MPVPPASAAEPLPGLRAGDGAAVEGNSGSAMVRVPVTLSGPSATAVSVDYTTSPGSATAGTDYLSRRGTLRIPAGSTSAAVSIPVIPDRIDEGNETVIVRLAGAVGAVVGRDTGTARILDDDPVTARQIGVGDSTVTEGASGTRRTRFVINLSRPRTSAVTVHYATADASARTGEDYVGVVGDATFAAGQTVADVSVPVVGDPFAERDEVFTLMLSAPSGAVLGRGSGRGVILNDDGAESVPSAPRLAQAVGGNGAAAVRWRAPNADGRSPIAGYTVRTSTDAGATWSAPIAGGTRREAIVNALANGAAVVFEVAALNALGSGPWSAPTSAVTPDAVTRYASLANGFNSSCGVTDVGSVECWGYNAEGQLGDGTTVNRPTPTPIAELGAGIQSVSLGGRGGCAITFGHGLLCWGDATSSGPNTFKLTPEPVVGFGAGVAAVSVGYGHSCVVTDASAAWCWGFGGIGGLNIDASYVPIPVFGLDHGVTQISAGLDRSCAVVNGAAWCWGNDEFGALGNGAVIYSVLPVAVVGLPGPVAQIETGGRHGCARLIDGAVMCWGFNSNGQLGDGSRTNSLVPVVALGSGATDLNLGASSCALVATGMQCWGLDPYDRTLTQAWPSPTTMAGLEVGVSSMSAHGYTPCVIQSGVARCFGWNFYGELGDGSTTFRTAPTRVLRATVPGAPAGLRATTQSHAAWLRWTDGVPGASPTTSYRARLSTDLGQTWTVRTLGWATPGQRLDGLDNGMMYTIEVAAGNAVGFGPWSDPAAVTPTPPTTSYTKVQIGLNSACGLTAAGAVRCWGVKGFPFYGSSPATGLSDTPSTIPGLENGASDVSLGFSHACAVTGAGAVRCWGRNSNGELGDGTTTDSPTPVAVTGLPSDAISVTTGIGSTCALLSDGHVMCWGSGAEGVLGNGTTTSSLVPVSVQDTTLYAAVDAGLSHVCGRTVAGGVRCWGSNRSGQLGNGGVGTQQLAPVDVVGLGSGVQSVASGDLHSCAVVDPGVLVCWGSNSSSQIGRGLGSTVSAPVAVPGLSGVAHAAVTGPSATCAVVDSGGLWCWGNEPFGDPFVRSYDPAPIGDLRTDIASAALGGSVACLLDTAGAVSCWGQDYEGQLGDGTTNQVLAPRVEPEAPAALSAVEHGDGFACGLTDAGGVQCWGGNDRGQLGDGTLESHAEPVAALGLASGVAQLRVGARHACVVLDDGAVRCWGDNASGQAGTGSAVLFRAVPATVKGLPVPTAQLSAGPASTCAVLVSGSLYCWGENRNGWLGVTGPAAAPVLVTGLGASVVRVTTSLYDTCAVVADGSISCWGYNYSGQVGDGTSTDRTLPVTVLPAGSGAVDVSISQTHACAVATGGVWCWGSGSGLFGTAADANRSLPALVFGLSGTAVSVSVTDHGSCALLVSGDVQCWGSNAAGLVGTGGRSATIAPVTVLTGVATLERGKRAPVQYATTQAGQSWWWGARGPVASRPFPVDIAD